MKRTNHINLSGQALCIDEDAYLKLQEYINTLENHYLKEEDGKEIMADIENRIAELFAENLAKQHKEVISTPDVEAMIVIMGSPADIFDGEIESATPPIRRRLYRDTEHAVIGGVAAGIAAFFNISSVWIRLVFLGLLYFSGASLWIYLLLWVVIPKAKTTRQKLEMHGQDANISNIEKKIKTAYQEVRQSNKVDGYLQRTGELLNNILTTIGHLLKRIFRIISGILAVAGLIIGGCLIMLCLSLLISPDVYRLTPLWSLPEYMAYLFSFMPVKLLWALFMLLPLLLTIFLSAKRLFHFRCSMIVVSMLLCGWLAVCLACVFVIFWKEFIILS